MAFSEAFDAVVEDVVDRDGPGAAIVVLRNGEVIHRKAYGFADLEWGTALSPDCCFRIASLTKQFTAAAIMRLSEDGALCLDDPLERHIPQWDPRGRIVTLRRLLNHTSGIRNHDLGAGPRTARPIIPQAEVLAQAMALPFDFEPGDRYRYSNSGYLLLGAVIEAVSGESYGRFLEKVFFAPLGMTRTGLFDADEIVPLRARGYVKGRRGLHNARPDPLWWSYSAGGLLSTLDDLVIWDRGLREGRVIRLESFAEMIAPTRLSNGTVYPYGLGWGTGVYGGRALHHHTGGVSGFASQMARLDDGSLTTIVLSNLYLFPFDKVTRGLLRVALGMPASAAAMDSPVAPDELAACQGLFRGDDDIQTTIGPDALDLSRFATSGDGVFRDPRDPEIAFRFSDKRDGLYHALAWSSPLWPSHRYLRG